MKSKLFIKLLISSSILPLSINAINSLKINEKFTVTNLDKYSHATTECYGLNLYNKRKFRLNIYITPSTYNVFLVMLQEYTKVDFLKSFLGTDEHWLDIGWKNVVHEIFGNLEEEAINRKLRKTFFQSLFRQWLESNTGWKLFEEIFQGKYLENNTYPMAPDYNSQKAQKEFRTYGAVLQLDFNYVGGGRKPGWYIGKKFCRIFPYSLMYASLEKYYEVHLLKRDGTWINVIPSIPIYIDKEPSPQEQMTVNHLLPLIQKSLLYIFSIDKESSIAKQIAISSDSFDTVLDYDVENSKAITLKFFKSPSSSQFVLCTKEIKLYLVKNY